MRGFIDEGNNAFQKTLATVGIIAVLYYASYFVVRESRTMRTERNGCPTTGCEEVILPTGLFYYGFNPLIHLDRYTSPDVEFRFEE